MPEHPAIAAARLAEAKLANIARTRRPTDAETAEARAAYEAAAAIKPATNTQRRTYVVNGCPTCELVKQHGGFGPPHDASPRCESGKHEHCTCDGCF